MPRKTPAELMGLGPEPTADQIRRRFRALVLPLHPDHRPDDPDGAKKFHALVKLREYLLLQARAAEAAPAARAVPPEPKPVEPPRQAETPVVELVPLAPTVIVPLDLEFEEAARGITVRFRVARNQWVSVVVEPGSTHGTTVNQRIVLRPGRTTPVVFEVRVPKHPRYRTRGPHLIVRVPWSERQTMQGDTLHIETPHDHVPVRVPPYQQRGEAIRVPGKGLHSPTGRGDLYVELADRDTALKHRAGRLGGD